MLRSEWGFYGRGTELAALEAVLARHRWFFARITGRRRIGKTTLIQRALEAHPELRVYYVQVPDSAPAGVLSAVADAMDTFAIAPEVARPQSLGELAEVIERMVRAGYVVVLDEFQYFSRKHLHEFTSLLQARVDGLARSASGVPGGLIVLGSIHAELVALLEERDAPLYNRTTDHLELDHLDVGSVLAILRAHADDAPHRLLMLWNLFEGVPKFYRDCFEQGALACDRQELVRRMFVRSSSPLRSEADNWFLSELRGRYDVVLKYIARHPGCSHAELMDHVRAVSPEGSEQIGGYLKALVERFRMVEKRLPVFAGPAARRGRYYLRDNFLRTWLAALASPISAVQFRPESDVLQQADERLMETEGHALERLVGQLYEERSRKGLGDFALTARVQGYWDRAGTELDLVALDDERRRLRLASCKRSPEKLIADLPRFDGHVARFLAARPALAGWQLEKVAIAPELSREARAAVADRGYLAQDLRDLTESL